MSARVLGLPFPGGPWIDKAAQCGDPLSIEFPQGLMSKEDLITHKFDFSFSGLKTAVARYIENTPQHIRADVAASFQEAVVDVLLQKSLRACKESGIDRLVIAGGVAANSRLRELATEHCQSAGVSLHIPSPVLCTDNGAMVASLGSLLVSAGVAATGALADSAASF